MDDVAVHVGEAEAAAAIMIGQFLVVDAQEVEDRGLEIMHVDRVFDGLEAEIIGSAP